MSRARNQNGITDAPVAHKANAPSSNPLEANPEHRAFLIRSLDRCDVEFTALTELNRSLHAVKASIIETCGEGTLLDIGEGHIKLTPNEDDLVGRRVHDQGQSLCVDFLLRMKLRRRLMNRLTRRLNRLAQAMDGHDVSPPIPPKYGDLRLHIDPTQVQEYATHWETQERAKRLLKERNEPVKIDSDGVVADVAPSSATTYEREYEVLKEFKDPYEKALFPTTGVIKYTVLDQPHDDDHMNVKFGAGIGAGHRTMSTREKEVEYKRWQAALLAKVPDQPTVSEIGMEYRVFALDERRKRIADGLKSTAAKKVKGEVSMTDIKRSDNPVKDVEASVMNENDKDEVTDPDEEKVEIEIENADLAESLLELKHTETAKDKEMDEKELSHDHKDDTKNETNLHKAQSSHNSIQKEIKDMTKFEKTVLDENDKDDSEEETDEEDDNEDSSESDEDDTSSTKDKKEIKGFVSDDEEESEDKGATANPKIPERIKPMSLLAVPSFHEQDMKRMRLIHADLMATSITDHARLKITETTTDYNNAYRMSTEIYHRRAKCQEEYQNAMQQHRMEIAKINNDYNMRASMAKSRYYKDLQNWNLQKARQVMQNMQGQMPVGTHCTQRASAHSNQIVNSIGLTLGRVVDAVVIKAERGSYDGEMFQTFQQPPPPDINNIVVSRSTGETFKHRQTRLEATFQNEISELNARFQKSEQERERAWRKLLKSKSEFDGGRRRFDPSVMPLPSLRSSGMVATPSVAPPAAAVASYVPQNRTYAGPESQSKYSAARIRGRISSDGSVMPASVPKKNKDGLYIRPAGRKRAGMDWDAHRGIWVPEAQYRG